VAQEAGDDGAGRVLSGPAGGSCGRRRRVAADFDGGGEGEIEVVGGAVGPSPAQIDVVSDAGGGKVSDGLGEMQRRWPGNAGVGAAGECGECGENEEDDRNPHRVPVGFRQAAAVGDGRESHT
jgi:hypothetical protein